VEYSVAHLTAHGRLSCRQSLLGVRIGDLAQSRDLGGGHVEYHSPAENDEGALGNVDDAGAKAKVRIGLHAEPKRLALVIERQAFHLADLLALAGKNRSTADLGRKLGCFRVDLACRL
jgi:hypothetical protein